jgi:hypothetical protein
MACIITDQDRLATLKLRRKRLQAALRELRKPPRNYNHIGAAITRISAVDFEIKRLSTKAGEM